MQTYRCQNSINKPSNVRLCCPPRTKTSKAKRRRERVKRLAEPRWKKLKDKVAMQHTDTAYTHLYISLYTHLPQQGTHLYRLWNTYHIPSQFHTQTHYWWQKLYSRQPKKAKVREKLHLSRCCNSGDMAQDFLCWLNRIGKVSPFLSSCWIWDSKKNKNSFQIQISKKVGLKIFVA